MARGRGGVAWCGALLNLVVKIKVVLSIVQFAISIKKICKNSKLSRGGRAVAAYEGLTLTKMRSRSPEFGRGSAVFGPFSAQTCARSAWFWPYEPIGPHFGIP
jgi:hypothetical protein